MQQGYFVAPSPNATQRDEPRATTPDGDGPTHGPDTPARADERASRLAQAFSAPDDADEAF